MQISHLQLLPLPALFIHALGFAACHGMLLFSLLLKPVLEPFIKCKISGASVIHRTQVSELSQALSHCRAAPNPQALLHTRSDLFWWVIAWGKGWPRRKHSRMTPSSPAGTWGPIRWKQAGIASHCPDSLETRQWLLASGKGRENISEASFPYLGSSLVLFHQTTVSRPTFCVYTHIFGLSWALVIYPHNLKMDVVTP